VEVKPDLEWRVSASGDQMIELGVGLWSKLIYTLITVPTFIAILAGAIKADRSKFRAE
jgi:hypothetical protein